MAVAATYPALVVAAYNRPAALRRLLHALASAEYPGAEVPLHLSLDLSGNPRIAEIAAQFKWPHGPKVVDQQSPRLGLREHILKCGDLTSRYGAIVLLEDDLLVSPWFYHYAQAALAHYADQDEIAGISLYKYAVAESCFLPFSPLQEASDTWFMQLPASWGQAWTAAQWQAFRSWLAENETLFQDAEDPILPAYMRSWSDQSWKKRFARYLLATGRYFVYPQVALSTNFGDPGTHADTGGLFQVPLLHGPKSWTFGSLATSQSVYDAEFELQPDRLKALCPALQDYDLAVDLYGQKDLAQCASAYVLSAREGGAALLGYAADMQPLLQNVLHAVPGGVLRLVRRTGLNPARVTPARLALQMGGGHQGALQDRLLRLSVVVPWTGTAQDHLPAIASVLEAQSYAHREVLVVIAKGTLPEELPEAVLEDARCRIVEVPAGTSYPEMLRQGFRVACGNFLSWLPAGAALQPGAITEMAAAYQQFPDSEWWVSLPESQEMKGDQPRVEQHRWEAARMRGSAPQVVLESLSPERVVFRRYLWEQVGAAEAALATGPALHWWARFCAVRAPQVVARNWSVRGSGYALPVEEAQAQPQFSQISGGWAVRWTGHFYRKDIRILRQLHLWLAQYPPVIRYNQSSGVWFASEY